MNNDQLRFRKTFDISEIKGFDAKDFVLRIQLDTMSSNNPVELPLVKIQLN
ncbi:hypothetical protein ACQKKK_24835 [Peribacillus sp. NPDC006672]|uniref:hypothetical protein n=1 Tax=Peribacillus sp. NPDC006672 TaxID=3390606 RepID=UPI003D049868